MDLVLGRVLLGLGLALMVLVMVPVLALRLDLVMGPLVKAVVAVMLR
jgi:hypothetical protein